MDWRPKNWVNPYSTETKYPEGMYAIDKAISEAFEAGADALLESLKQEALVRRIRLPATSKVINDLSDFELKKSGWLVFITDEDKK